MAGVILQLRRRLLSIVHGLFMDLSAFSPTIDACRAIDHRLPKGNPTVDQRKATHETHTLLPAQI